MVNERNLAFILVRVGGIVLLVNGVSSIADNWSIYETYYEKSLWNAFIVGFAPSVLPIVVGLMLAASPRLLVSRFSETDRGAEEADTETPSLARLLIAGLGVYFIVHASVDLVYYATWFAGMQYPDLYSADEILKHQAGVVASVFQAIVGFGLVAASARVARVAFRERDE